MVKDYHFLLKVLLVEVSYIAKVRTKHYLLFLSLLILLRRGRRWFVLSCAMIENLCRYFSSSPSSRLSLLENGL